MKVLLAKELGYCFGVKRAMQMAWDELKSSNNNTTYALGPLIHNKQAVERYEQNGLKTVDEISNIPQNESIVIRSHGVSKSIYDISKENNLNVIDTTCPFVVKIHKIVEKNYNNGYQIIIIGDKNHPEVIGINGWCNNSAIIIKNMDDLNNISFSDELKYCVVAQTTINLVMYSEIVDYLKNNIKNIEFNNTICGATKERQESARNLAKEVDAMIVIGGKHSSNTQKLVQICMEYAYTYSIETSDDLNLDDLKKYNTVGISAGASTPDWLIDDVINTIENI